MPCGTASSSSRSISWAASGWSLLGPHISVSHALRSAWTLRGFPCSVSTHRVELSFVYRPGCRPRPARRRQIRSNETVILRPRIRDPLAVVGSRLDAVQQLVLDSPRDLPPVGGVAVLEQPRGAALGLHPEVPERLGVVVATLLVHVEVGCRQQVGEALDARAAVAGDEHVGVIEPVRVLAAGQSVARRDARRPGLALAGAPGRDELDSRAALGADP